MRAEGGELHSVVMEGWHWGRREKRQILAPVESRQPRSIIALSWENIVIFFFFEEDAAVVVTQFSDAHQVVMEVRHYVTALYGDSGMIRSQDSEETCGGAPAVMTTTWQSEGLTLA